MRIFIGLSDVSGYYYHLSKGFEDLGVQANLVTLVDHRFEYSDKVAKRPGGVWLRFARWSLTKRQQATGQVKARLWFAVMLLARAFLLAWAIVRHDVFILSCGNSFFRFREFVLLRLLGKRIIYVFHGTDERAAFLDGFAEDIHLPEQFRTGSGFLPPLDQVKDTETRRAVLEAYRKLTLQRRATVLAVERHADVIIGNPASAHHHQRAYVKFCYIGLPFAPNASARSKHNDGTAAAGRKLMVVHSPSYPLGKGSDELRASLERVCGSLDAIEYVEIRDRPNREVLEYLARCDFAMDQLYSDTPMAGFAVEAAFFGKPAVVGGYYADHIEKDYDPGLIPPTSFCFPEAIDAAIEKLVKDAHHRREIGNAAREFVQNHWTARHCAEKYLRIIDSDPPKEWMCDPMDCRYVGGMGLPRARLIEIIRSLNDTYGQQVFCLDDKPELLAELLALASASPIGQKSANMEGESS
ncbi:glycosyltransferase [uncultured Roseobacter sp.]|uniref:glycosyltransferase n=1 Tax=uncultured Roseobacter sp. TaxID=114847 RepID=UPI002615C2CE|nr:glycosyltransferase [uncultured Roseobacter sp.]